MKSKRQTIWLVSMLSLMVVLSAYYLFTEEGPAPAAKTDGQQVSMDGGTAQNGGLEGSGLSAQDEVILSEVASDGEAAALPLPTTKPPRRRMIPRLQKKKPQPKKAARPAARRTRPPKMAEKKRPKRGIARPKGTKRQNLPQAQGDRSKPKPTKMC